MPRGTGLATTRRLNRKAKASSPEALAACLPHELRSLEGLATLEDIRGLQSAVADWLHTAAPCKAQELTHPVMTAAGLSATEMYRHALAHKAELVEWVPSQLPTDETPSLMDEFTEITEITEKLAALPPEPRKGKTWNQPDADPHAEERAALLRALAENMTKQREKNQ